MRFQFTLLSLLVILISACTQQATTLPPPTEEAQPIQPAPSNTGEAGPPTTTASPDLAATERALPRPTFETATVAVSVCPGAPAPHVAFMGKQVTVVANNKDVDQLKLRSEPKISPDTVIRDLAPSTQLKIIGGFVCVHSEETGTSYWFWKVQVLPSGETGWIAEGDQQHSFLELSIVQPVIPTNAATTASACSGVPALFSVGDQVTVIAGDSDKLKLRSEPKISPDTVKRELDQFTPLKILDGPLCVHSDETGSSYWFWKVQMLPNGQKGWVAEGDGLNYFLEHNAP